LRQTALLLSLAGSLTAPPALGADLYELFQEAQQVDPTLERAEKERVIADYQEDQAQAGWFPSLTGQASVFKFDQEQTSTFGGVPSTDNFRFQRETYSLTLTQPLFMGGRTWLSVDLAEFTQAKAESGISAARQDLMLRVAEAYFSVLDSQEEVELAEREVRRVEEHLERARAQFEVGTGDITGVREAEARRDQARTSLIRARNNLRTAQQRLRRLIRRPTPELARVEEVTLTSPDPNTPDAWVDRALEQNPNLEQTRQDLQIARKNVDLAKRDRWPELSAQAQYSKSEGGAFTKESTDKSVGLQLNWPIYQGGAVSAEANIEQERAAQTRLQLDDQQQEVRVQTIQAFHDWESALEEVRSLRAQVTSTKTQLDAVQTGFEVGRRTSVDVLDAQQEYFDALRSLAQARHQYLLARLELKAAVGVLGLDDLRAANRQLN
jgi:outer membrane protein